MSLPFIGLSGKQKYWMTLLTDLYIISACKVSISEEYLQKWWNANYEKWVSVGQMNIKLLLETVTYIATVETVTCIKCNRNSHVHNALQKIMWRKLWSFQKCGEKTNKVVHEKLTLDWSDLIIFKCFRVTFSLKRKIIQFPLSFNLHFLQKRAPKLSICHLLTKRSVWVFGVINRANGFSSFQSYHEVVMNLFNSLAKSCTLIWKYS